MTMTDITEFFRTLDTSLKQGGEWQVKLSAMGEVSKIKDLNAFFRDERNVKAFVKCAPGDAKYLSVTHDYPAKAWQGFMRLPLLTSEVLKATKTQPNSELCKLLEHSLHKNVLEFTLEYNKNKDNNVAPPASILNRGPQ